MLDPRFEHVAERDPAGIRCIHRVCDDLATDHDWHFHPEYELTWFVASRGTRYAGDGVRRYEAGDLVLSGPDLPHCWRNDVDGPGDNRAEWISVQFAPGCFGAGFLDLPEASAIGSLLRQADVGLAFAPAAVRSIEHLLREMPHLDGILPMLRLAEILERLSHAPHERLASATWRRHATADRLGRVMRHVEEHFRGVVSQSDLAGELGMSASAFSKFVRAATGQTFSSIVRQARVNEACRLLSHGEGRITDIALECGYTHTSHFDHQFHALKGVSPSEYRRLMRALATTGAARSGK